MAVKIIPISEMRQKLKEVFAKLEATGEPYFITQYSRPKAVLVRYEDYNALVEQAEEGQARIVCQPDISGGEPIIRGTRISVRHIVERLQAGQTIEEILEALPHLTPAQIHDSLSYYHTHQTEIDQLIKENRPDEVIATQGLRVNKITKGGALVHDETGRW